MSIIDSIQLSGSSYDVRDKSATTVVSLTQQEYDALPSSAKTANILYNITDAQAGDLTQYWTSAQTQSAITEATSGLQQTLTAGTGIDITDNVISATGGGGGGGGGNPTVELTQAQYDALVTAGTVSADTYYIITDAPAITVTTAITSSSTDTQVPSAKAVYDQLGGLKLVKLTQSEYDALAPNYDSNTLYVIVN